MDITTINQLLGITESYQAPQRMLDIMFDDEARPKLFDAFLEHEYKMDYEWFQSYFQDEHADRRIKKQDFTPESVSILLSKLVDSGDHFHEMAAGTGSILIKAWWEQRKNESPLTYDPRSKWFHAEELSDRSIPFLIFNMAIRGMNGVILHGDSLNRHFKEVYFIRNDTDDYLAYSEVIIMPHTDDLMQELDIRKWI